MRTHPQRRLLGIVFVVAFAAPLAWAVARGAPSEDVAVYPAPGTTAANPASTISLRGVDPSRVPQVAVVGSESGAHDGALRAHRDGRGVTFTPDGSFTPGEQVTVDAEVLGSVTFTVATPGDIPDREDRSDGITDVDPQVTSFATRPDVVAPVVEQSGEPLGRLLLTTPAVTNTTPAAAMITDDAGEVVWWRGSDDPDLSLGNLQTGVLDGEPVLSWYEGSDPDGPGWYEGEWVIVDDTYTEVARIPGANGMPADIHDLELTDRGTAWIMAYHPVVMDVTAHGGTADTVVMEAVVQEVDVATGDVHFEWHSLDHVPLEWSVQAIREDDVWDYIHINSVTEEPDGDLVISARHTSMVGEIDRETGAMGFVIGGPGQNVDLGEDRGISFPHHARWIGDDLLSLFDNGVSFDPQTSRGVVYRLDAERTGAEVAAEYVTAPPLFTNTQGSLDHLDDGRALATWTEEHVASLFSDASDGPPTEVGRIDLNAPSYRAFTSTWSATPADAPAVVVDGDEVLVSWNGATDVAQWQVLAGGDPVVQDADALEVADTVQRDGFETAVPLPPDAAVVAVRAVDERGTTLGVSAPLRLQPAG